MKTLAEVFKTLILCLVTAQVMYLFLRKTFAGRCILMCFRIVGELFKLTYLSLEHLYKFLNRQSNKFREAKNEEQPSLSKKTASGEVVDFTQARKKSTTKPKPTA
jgi:hypothetical protein